MTQEEALKEAIDKVTLNKCIIFQLATGFGKTSLAIKVTNHLCDLAYKIEKEQLSVLIVVAKKVHKQVWQDEIAKWGGLKTDLLTIECYESLKKYRNCHVDVIIFDEMHHLSEARLDILRTIKVHYNIIGLSATIKKDLKEYMKKIYNAHIISCSIKEAIEGNILPEPIVYLLPLELDNKILHYKIKRFSSIVTTTQRGYYNNLSGLVEWYKNKFYTTGNIRMKNLWLSTALKRLVWLSEQKEHITKLILSDLWRERTLTFCSSIDQAERLGKYNITSKNKQSDEYFNLFNKGKINHITACSILNEGVNLVNCRIGIFNNLNKSEIITKQRIGRTLRHKSPIVIIPYYKNTREEELVDKMLEEYPQESIYRINTIKEIKL